MTCQIILDLSRVADAGERNAHLLDRVARQMKQRLRLDDSLATIMDELRAHCTVTPSPSGDVLQGWCLRRGSPT